MGYSFTDLIQCIVSERGDAVHLHDGEVPVLEIRGLLTRIEGPRLEIGETEALFRGIAPKEEFQEMVHNGLASFVFRYNETTSFRLMAFREDSQARIELRRV